MFRSMGKVGVITAGARGIGAATAKVFNGGLGSNPDSMPKEVIIGLTRSTACELTVHGIRVNCISHHEMLIGAYRKIGGKNNMIPEEVSKIVGERGSLLRGRSPGLEDMAQGVLFPASEEAGYIAAHNLLVDGGYTAASSNMSIIYQ